MTSFAASSKTVDSGSVLVIDDDDECRQMLAVALETVGFHVLEARSELEVQRYLTHTRPDALVLDLQRSEADGLKMVARLRARHNLRDVPIVFLAGCQDDDFRAEATHAGADWFGLRPLSMLELQSRVGDLIRNGRPNTPDERAARPAAAARRLKPTG